MIKAFGCSGAAAWLAFQGAWRQQNTVKTPFKQGWRYTYSTTYTACGAITKKNWKALGSAGFGAAGVAVATACKVTAWRPSLLWYGVMLKPISILTGLARKAASPRKFARMSVHLNPWKSCLHEPLFSPPKALGSAMAGLEASAGAAAAAACMQAVKSISLRSAQVSSSWLLKQLI